VHVVCGDAMMMIGEEQARTGVALACQAMLSNEQYSEALLLLGLDL
jgi:hypothetical protein